MKLWHLMWATALDGGAGGADDDDGGDKDKDGDKGKDKDNSPDTASMSAAELKTFADDMLKQKRVANDEAKAYRTKAEALQTEKDDVDKKAKDAEKTTADKLAEANTKIETLNTERKSLELKSSATTDLMKDGFPLDIIEVGLGGLTDENSKDTIAAFKKKFESYKADPKTKPDATAHRHRKPDGSIQPTAAHSLARAATAELEQHGK